MSIASLHKKRAHFYATTPFRPPSHNLGDELAPCFYDDYDDGSYFLTKEQAEYLYMRGTELLGTETMGETADEGERFENDTLRDNTTRLSELLSYHAHSPYVVLCIERMSLPDPEPIVLKCHRSLVLFFLHENATAPDLTWPYPTSSAVSSFRLTDADIWLMEVMDYYYTDKSKQDCEFYGSQVEREMEEWIASSPQRLALYHVFCRDLASTRSIPDVKEEMYVNTL